MARQLTGQQASSEELASRVDSPAIAPDGDDTYGIPRLLPVCCVCGLVRDDAAPHLPDLPAKRVSWVMLNDYRHATKTELASFHFTHTYCPDCLMQVLERVQEYFRTAQVEARSG